jgi:hypothetical protein
MAGKATAQRVVTKIVEIGPVSEGGNEDISYSQPYTAHVTLRGSSDLLFHRWNCEAVKEKAEAAKNSKAKKTDNVESYVWRNEKGEICLPGEYVRQSIIHAAKFRQDPRSPRKSAMDLYKAALLCETELAPLGVKECDYLHMGRVVVQRQGVTRTRPAMRSGWTANFSITVILSEYVNPKDLHDVIVNAGRLVGVADFRPTYGRFQVTNWKVT